MTIIFKQVLCFTIILATTLSCSSRKTSEKTLLQKSPKQLSLNKSIIEIEHDSEFLNSLYSIGSLYENQYYTYNQGTHSLDIFSLDLKNHIKTISLHSEGPEGVESSVMGIVVMETDTIALLTENSITLINQKGLIIEKIKINGASSDDYFLNYYLHSRNTRNFIYDKNSNSFFIPIVSLKNPRVTKEFFKHPIFAEYNIEEKNVHPFDMFYPDRFYDVCHGFNDQKSFSYIKGDTIFYTLSGYPAIFLYDRKSKESIEIEISLEHLSNFQIFDQPWSRANDIGLQMKTMMKSSQFGPICETDDYLILFYHSALKGDQNDLSNPYARKDKLMQIYDKRNLSYITTEELPEEVIVVKNLYVRGNSILLPISPKTENVIRIQKIDLIEK